MNSDEEINNDELAFTLHITTKWRMKSILKTCIWRCAKQVDLIELEKTFKDLPSEGVACLMIYASCRGDFQQFNPDDATLCSDCETTADFLCGLSKKPFCKSCRLSQAMKIPTIDALLER